VAPEPAGGQAGRCSASAKNRKWHCSGTYVASDGMYAADSVEQGAVVDGGAEPCAGGVIASLRGGVA